MVATQLTTVEPMPHSNQMERRLFLLLGAIAVLFAALMGFKTLYDPDFFWQLATGRWVAQHHRVFSIDVFSYTIPGKPWVYPVGSGLLFYGFYLLGGYNLLSWLGVVVGCGTVALLLRRGSAFTAAIAIIAVPIIANSTTPRAQMFTILLFAAYLSLLSEYYQTARAALWLLPLLMVAWVNLHLGFVAGLGLIAAFAFFDLVQLLKPELRRRSLDRLKRAFPWFVATVLSTLANPFGWNIYQALIRQNRAMAEHSEWLTEWGAVPLSWASLLKGMSPSDPSSFYLLLVVATIATVAAALWEREFAAAILLVGSGYEGVQHVRMQALAACVVAVVGGSVLFAASKRISARIPDKTARAVLAAAFCAVFAWVAVTWSVHAIKPDEMSLSAFGTGLGWWFPQNAATFLQREKIPGEILNTHAQGGYLIWRLGPNRLDYIDGRAIPFGREIFIRQAQLWESPPDSNLWTSEANRYDINAILLPLNRFQPEIGKLKSFCASQNWAPVYLDEVSAVFVRRNSDTEDLIRRLGIDCATARLPLAVPTGSSSDRFNIWANSAVILSELGRNDEAIAAADHADQALPNTGFVPWLRGNVAYSRGNLASAEEEYLKAISRDPNVPLLWFSLAAVYKHERKIPETIRAQSKAIELSTLPQPYELLKLARLYLDVQRPQAALETFDAAARSASPDMLAQRGEHSLQFEIDEGRAGAWRALGDTKKAASFDQQAVQDLVTQN